MAAVAVDVVGRAVRGALAGLPWVRGGRVVHPHGALHRAAFAVDGAPHAPAAARLLATAAEYPALVRFSRSLGLPRPLPDLLLLTDGQRHRKALPAAGGVRRP